MKYLLISITALITIVLFVTAGMVYFSATPTETELPADSLPQTEDSNSEPLPAQAITIGESQPPVTSATATRVLTFTETVRDPMNVDEYIIYGQSTDCATVGNCEGDTPQDFSITYDAREDFFNIVLYQEPLRVQREAAETILINELGFTREALCVANYQVGVPYWVSETYTGQDLRFSFCPDAVEL